MSKSSIAEIITEIRSTRQLIPTEKLLKWLRNLDFNVRDNTGGSHVFVSHKTETDIYDTLIINTTKLSTQRGVRVMLQKLEKRQTELSKEFSKKALSPKYIQETLDQKIPADLAYSLTDSGNIVLTDRAYPQLGLTFAQNDVRLAENQVRELTSMKRDYAVMLCRMTSEYDVSPITMQNGVFNGRLTHQVYDHIPVEDLPTYKENDEPGDALMHLYAYVEKIEDVDLEHACRKEDILAQPHILQTIVTSASRRGERHNHVYYAGRGGEKLSLVFSTFSNLRATYNGKTSRISASELQHVENMLGNKQEAAWQQLKAA